MRRLTASLATLFVLSAVSLVGCGDDEAAPDDQLELVEVTATPEMAQAPAEIAFTVEATGGSEPYEAVWSFDDEINEEEASGLEVAHTFYREGTYEVSVELTDAEGSVRAGTVEVAIEPADPPTVSATASPEMGIAPLDTTFETSAEGGSGEFEYEWSFGDGSSSNEANPAHRYIIGGTYEASVIVTDVMTDKQSTAEVVVEVADDEQPFVSATADPARGIAPLNVSFGSQVFGGNEPLSYEWDFGDGSDPVETETPAHEYTDPGQYKAVLTVEDADGDRAHSEVNINVLDNQVPSVDIFADETSGIAPLTVQFDPQAQGGDVPLEFAWDFGTGDTSDSQKPSYTFADEGTFTVTVTATDTNGDTAQDTIDIEVTSDEVPDVDATATPMSGLAPLQVQFQATATGGNGTLSYSWSFGEGTTADIANPTHTYTSAGQYTATVTVRDENGDTDTSTLSIDVGDDLSPVANVSATPTSGRAPLTADFFANASGGNGQLDYSWSWGDGSPADTTENPTHTFTSPGSYNVSLIVTDQDGSSDQSSVTIDVFDNVQPLANASATPTSGIAPLNVEFDVDVTQGDAPFTYEWDFGDGTPTADIQRPSHSYTTGGTFTATVTVTDDDGDTVTDTVDISVADDEVPTVDASSDVDTGLAPLAVQFDATATGGNGSNSFTWYFGDGAAPASGASVSHTYQNPGIYEATVVVTDVDGDTASDKLTINVQDYSPDLTVQSFTATRTSSDVEFEVVIENIGTTTATNTFYVRIYHDEDQSPTSSTNHDRSTSVFTDIPAGGTHTVTFTSTNLDIGSYDSWAWVDPEHESPDLNRGNNIAGPESFEIDGVLINEVYYDTVGADNADETFIELYGLAGQDLSGYELEAINGSDGSVYKTITLPQGTTIPADGYLVIATANHPEVDVTESSPDLQNGPDNLVLNDPQGGESDAVGYGDFATATFVGEGLAARDTAEGQSLGRNASQADTNDNASDFYTWSQPTPGAANIVNLVNEADTCADAYDVNAGAEGLYFIEGNLGGATNTYTERNFSGSQGSCGATSSTFAGPDQIFELTVPTGETADVRSYLDDNANVDIDMVLTESPCSSLDTGMVGCNVSLTEYFTLTEGTYYFVVLEDGGNNLSSSDEPYTLELEVDFQ